MPSTTYNLLQPVTRRALVIVRAYARYLFPSPIEANPLRTSKLRQNRNSAIFFARFEVIVRLFQLLTLIYDKDQTVQPGMEITRQKSLDVLLMYGKDPTV